MTTLVDVLDRVAALESDSQGILATHEAAPARTVTLEKSYARLDGLSVDQDELFRESLRAVEAGLFRAAHALAWAGFVDFLHNHFASDDLKALAAVRPKWKLAAADDLREYADYAVIEAGKAAGFYPKSVMKALHGLLNKRNESAHPSEYFPDLNETLGYISELLQRMEYLQKKAGP